MRVCLGMHEPPLGRLTDAVRIGAARRIGRRSNGIEARPRRILATLWAAMGCARQAAGPLVAGVLLITGAAGRAAAQTEIVVTSPLPAVLRAGEPSPSALRVAVRDAQGNAVRGVPVRVEVADPAWRITGDELVSDATGSVAFTQLVISGPRGSVELFVVAGTARQEMNVNVVEGLPRKLVILTQPPARIISDSLFARAPRVRVEDASGNVLANQEVEVTLCVAPDEDTLQCEELDADLVGRRYRRPEEDGTITFDSLSVSGPGGKYYLYFDITACPRPGGHLKVLHPWPGQNPPPEGGGNSGR